MSQLGQLALYVHIPFCRSKCGYCDFASMAAPPRGFETLAEAYASKVIGEIERSGTATARGAAASRRRPVGSIFFGGGTPTLVPAEILLKILDCCRRLFGVLPDAEITVEANPESSTYEGLAQLRAGGVNRLSLGVQSFDDPELRRLGRVHDAAEALKAVEAARAAGFENVSLDVIFATAGQTPASWKGTLKTAIDLGPEHISAYCLTVEEGTPLGRQVACGLVRPATEELQGEMFRLAADTLGGAGYRHYEISNYAKPGFECRHNLTYWRRRDYLGFGASAHSCAGNIRWSNVPSVEDYLSASCPVDYVEQLTGEQVEQERLMLGLRLAEGVAFAERAWEESGRLGMADGLLEVDGATARLTERGFLFADEVITRLIPG